MQKDFYLNERSAAAYLEKDWFDHLVPAEPKSLFAFAPFDPAALYCDYHERMVEGLAKCLREVDVQPKRMLEVGSSLGRTFYEVCKRIESVESAALVEPSENLNCLFDQIFAGEDSARFSVLSGNSEFTEIEINTGSIQAACKRVKVERRKVPFQNLEDRDGFNLAICSNVIDQCADPHKLVDLLKNSVVNKGVVALSCTYQWNAKYIGNAPLDPISNVCHLFGTGWKLLGEMNLPFALRANERHWLTFMSHVVIYQKG